MPFTVSHVALAPPLRHLIGRRLPLSALVIGCMMPDAPYFVLGRIAHGRLSHSLPGLPLVCLPAGFLLFYIFHTVIREPLQRLLPVPVQERLRLLPPPLLGRWRTGTAAALAILLGSASHLAWDSFTHPWGAGAQAIPLLLEPVMTLGDHPIRPCMLLQWFSGVGGLLVLWLFLRAWYRRALAVPLEDPPLSSGRRWGVLLAVLGAAVAVAVVAGILGAAPGGPTFHRVHEFLVFAVVAGISTTAVLCTLYAAFVRFSGRLRLPGDAPSRRGYT